jgi:hypothetical protein
MDRPQARKPCGSTNGTAVWELGVNDVDGALELVQKVRVALEDDVTCLGHRDNDEPGSNAPPRQMRVTRRAF